MLFLYIPKYVTDWIGNFWSQWQCCISPGPALFAMINVIFRDWRTCLLGKSTCDPLKHIMDSPIILVAFCIRIQFHRIIVKTLYKQDDHIWNMGLPYNIPIVTKEKQWPCVWTYQINFYILSLGSQKGHLYQIILKSCRQFLTSIFLSFSFWLSWQPECCTELISLNNFQNYNPRIILVKVGDNRQEEM